MHQSVRDSFHKFSGPLEGADVPFMYLDSLGLVTFGTGNLADPIELALDHPWEWPDGKRATRGEIASAWHIVKARQDMAKLGGMAFRKLTTLRLSKEALRAAFFRKLDQHEAILSKRFPEWDLWPADAQLGVHSMAWAMGGHFTRKFPKFTAACLRGDFAGAATECAISPARGTVIERNRRNRVLFENAAEVASDWAQDRS